MRKKVLVAKLRELEINYGLAEILIQIIQGFEAQENRISDAVVLVEGAVTPTDGKFLTWVEERIALEGDHNRKGQYVAIRSALEKLAK